MCGRFAIVSPAKELQKAFKLALEPKNLGPRYNAAPGQLLAVIPNTKPRLVYFYKWGLVPPWSKDTKMGQRLINARAESLWKKRSFKKAAESRRCIVPADGFFEWKKTAAGKIPFFIRSRNKTPFAFAGLWEVWEKASEPFYTFTIITTEANSLVSKIHNRMPAIIDSVYMDLWLSEDKLSADDLQHVLRPFESDSMEAFAVSSRVNSVSNDGPELIQKIEVRPMEQTSLL